MIRERARYELDCRFDSRQSFYGKAKVIEYEDGSSVLRSYTTYVACITPEGNGYIDGFYSGTTTRHIKEYLRRYLHEDNLPKAKLEKKYCDEEFNFKEFCLDRGLR